MVLGGSGIESLDGGTKEGNRKEFHHAQARRSAAGIWVASHGSHYSDYTCSCLDVSVSSRCIGSRLIDFIEWYQLVFLILL